MANPIQGCSDADLKRFALCWLFADRSNITVDWAAAAAAYDPKVQVQSFKTVTGRAVTKALSSAGIDEGEKPKKAAAGKRKKVTSEAGAEDEDAPKPKKGKAGRAKKAKSEEKAPSDVEDNGEGDKSD
ncbi:hypothetical protein M409DRAFT_50262 [Zasmidium cellare ATCC 36951]|uniref:Uncharacterized protein n=1 Tax=Zasmidium cellare ATCC 36951 TaxID=1080233 RepID=A0A6A6CWL3_ZASCE|nr:uncharacterized protein M409DRAFT_50262 [Zasmidium cellare ATCC 36951]KAF2171587.1 hypothetical protein M409DRAFT_50262 [Zasmidium cellare ATCC 36951]